MPRAMPRPGPSATAREAALEEINIGELRIRAPPPSWTTTATVSSVLAWGALAVHNILALPKLDGVPPVSFERVRASGKFVPKYVSMRDAWFRSERMRKRTRVGRDDARDGVDARGRGTRLT